jgi:hypothetical protein
MSLKQRIEESPVIYFLGALVTGYLAGFGTYDAILRIAKLDTVQQGAYMLQKDIDRDYVRRSDVPAATTPISNCPIIAGDWHYQTPEGIPLIISQTGCSVSGTYETVQRRYIIKAEFSSGAFHGNLLKIPKAASDCNSNLPLLIRVGDGQARLTMIATGVDCDGSANNVPGIWVQG